jgi:hypothetical protein
VDAHCAGPADLRELPNPTTCGLGAEVAFAVLPLLAWRSARRARRRRS